MVFLLQTGHGAVAKLLLQYGADANAKDKFGLTPLMLAASRNDVDTIRELIKFEANVNVW